MKKLIFITCLICLPSFAFASNEVTFFSGVAQTVQDMSDFFNGIPDFLTRLLADFVEWYVLWQIKSQVFFLGIAYQTAQHLIQDLNVTNLVNQAFTNIPPSFGHYINLFQIPDCITFLFDCYMTRFVMSFMGIR